MGILTKGEVVVVPFPFSDLSTTKKRPALVLTSLEGNDVVLCQITSKKRKDIYSISLLDNDFSNGKLKIDSNVRPQKLFTMDSSLIEFSVGKITSKKFNQVIKQVCTIIS